MKRKLQRFSELGSFSNVFQKDCNLKGNWNKEYFLKDSSIILELGCGRGEYTLALYEKNSNHHYIGIDIKGARLWRGAKSAFDSGIKEIAFIRTQIESLLDYFSENEVSEIWITFPDPQISGRRERKRLTHPRFLAYYRTILNKGGLIHLKTDSKELFEYSEQSLRSLSGTMVELIRDVHAHPFPSDHLLKVLTTYEKKFLKEKKPINYLCYQLDK